MSAGSLAVAIAELFRETFEGVAEGADGTWFVQGKEAIFDALRSLSAEEASRRVPGQPFSISSHSSHLNYYLTLFNANLRGENPKSDWEGSWVNQEFDDAQWKQLALDMDRE